MAIAHVCPRCGLDLSRLRAVPDIHYGLRVVVCPGCRFACVRRPHPIAVAWRRAWGVGRSLVRLAFQAGALAAFSGASVGTVVLTANTLSELRLGWAELPGALAGRSGGPGLDADEVAALRIGVLAWVVVALAAGTWLSATLAHWRLPALWGAWAGWLLMVGSLDGIIYPFQSWYAALGGEVSYVAPPRLNEWGPRVAALMAGVALASAAIPVGRGIRAMGPALERRVLAWRRRKLRKRREG